MADDDPAAFLALFEQYRRWYRDVYTPETEEEFHDEGDFAEYGWADPLGGLQPVDPDSLPEAASPTYKLLLTEIGAGRLLASGEEEPQMFRIVHPTEQAKEREAFLSWLTDEVRGWILDRQGLDVTRMIPMLADGPAWALLAAQGPQDDPLNSWNWSRKRGGAF